MVVALVMWLGISGAGQSAEAISEAEITSAILFNFARYTRWPEQDNATGEGQVAFCFFDTAGLADVFEGMVGGATLKGRRVTVIRVTAAAELAGCQLVYTDDPLPAWLGRPDYRLLTIGRGDQFVTNGGVIALIQEDNHLRFKINRRVARDTGLVLSSRLLRLAEELIDE
jgi:hypothetical protein